MDLQAGHSCFPRSTPSEGLKVVNARRLWTYFTTLFLNPELNLVKSNPPASLNCNELVRQCQRNGAATSALTQLEAL